MRQVDGIRDHGWLCCRSGLLHGSRPARYYWSQLEADDVVCDVPSRNRVLFRLLDPRIAPLVHVQTKALESIREHVPATLHESAGRS